VDQRAVLGVDREFDRLVLSGVVVDVRAGRVRTVASWAPRRPVGRVAERRLPPAEQHVLAVGVALQHCVVERGERAVDGDLGGVHVEAAQLDRLVRLDDDLVAPEFGDPAELRVARDGVAVARERHVALAELRDGVARLAGAKLPASVVDLRLSRRL